MRIVTRAEWGFDGWAGSAPTAVNEKAQRTEFFTHYEGSAAVRSQLGAAVPRAIHRLHKANGWKGIGYGHVVTADGTIYEGRGFNYTGSHCPNHNTSGYSAQIHIGGNEQPTEAQLVAQRWLYDEACRRSGRKLAMRGHRDGVATACPGENLYRWVKAGMPAPTTKPSPVAPQEDDMPDPRDLWAYEYKGRQALSYLVTADANARAARADASAALELAKAQAAAGRPLTAEEIEAAAQKGAKTALDEKIADATTILGVKP